MDASCEGFRRDRGCWRVVCVCLSTNHTCVCVCTVLCSARGSKILLHNVCFDTINRTGEASTGGERARGMGERVRVSGTRAAAVRSCAIMSSRAGAACAARVLGEGEDDGEGGG